MTQEPLHSPQQKAEFLARVETLLWDVFVTETPIDDILAVVSEQYDEQSKMYDYFDFIDIVEKGLDGTVKNPGPDEN